MQADIQPQMFSNSHKKLENVRMERKNLDFIYAKVCIETWVRHVGAQQQMHMEAITFLFHGLQLSGA